MPKIQPFTIIKDSREQEGYTFKPSSSRYHKCEGMVVRKLDTGDYSLEGLEDKVCIERKASVVEFANNIGHDMVRFNKEIKRMMEFPHRFMIFEFSLSDLMDFPDRSGIPQEDWGKLKVTNKLCMPLIRIKWFGHMQTVQLQISKCPPPKIVPSFCILKILTSISNLSLYAVKG